MKKLKKVGILTHPLRDNYGGILQAWAMQVVLRRMNVDVETFAFNGREVSKLTELNWAAKRAVLKILGRCDIPVFYEHYIRKKQRKVKINLIRFIKGNIKFRHHKSVKEICGDDYDTIVVGSDQVWRDAYIEDMCQSPDKADAFLYSLRGDCERIAYAASFGTDTWNFTDEETSQIREALSKFKAVSVREVSGVGLAKHVGCKAEWALDPTMLLKAEDYLSMARKKVKDAEIGRGKVVSYILDTSEEKNKIIRNIMESRQCDNLELNITEAGRVKTSIEDWLLGIANAEIVVTDSFHGCVFSIIFGKPLVFVMNAARGNARFDSLIEKFGIEDNCVKSIEDFNPDKDYSLPADLKEKLDKYRLSSERFLTEALK